MIWRVVQIQILVHCRTGSLEISMIFIKDIERVHCRTGSLEMDELEITRFPQVHCRTGSLEKPLNLAKK